MTRAEALEILKAYRKKLSDSVSNQLDEDIKAFDMAIQALEQTELKPSYNSVKPELDLISRQAVLEKSYKIAGYDRNAYVVDVADIEALPSVKLCEDAINRKDAINAMSNSLERVFPEHRDIAERAMNKLPSVSTEKTGWWIEQEGYDGDTYYDCSECGESFCLIDGTPTDNLYNYCPNCGCRMVEPQESEEKK